MSLLAVLSAILLSYLLFKYHWNRRKLYALSAKLNGPISLPIIGDAWLFSCENEQILHRIQGLLKKHRDPFRVWLGPEMLVCFKNPDHVEKIFSSSKFAHKHGLYNFLKVFLGEGLVSGSGPTYKKHRRIIQPLFSMKYCASNVELLNKYMEICVRQLDKFVDKGTFDIRPVLHKIVLDFVGESLLGAKIEAHRGKNKEFVDAVHDMYDFIFTRVTRPWLHPDLIFNLTPLKKRQDELLEATTGFMNRAIRRSSERVGKRTRAHGQFVPIIDQLMLFAENNENSISDEDFFHHMFTLLAASEDTITIVAAFTCMCLGMYPEYQAKAAQEIREVFGEEPRHVTVEDVAKLNYLDFCIKDVMRLVPIAPYILRTSTDEAQIGEWRLPRGTPVVVPIFDIHRDPEHWENPQHFHPDHFLPEAAKRRHVYAYVPFSAGPRGCIGKILAKFSVKVILANILQRFEFEREGQFPDCPLKIDISTRPLHGHTLRIRKRKWPPH